MGPVSTWMGDRLETPGVVARLDLAKLPTVEYSSGLEPADISSRVILQQSAELNAEWMTHSAVCKGPVFAWRVEYDSGIN